MQRLGVLLIVALAAGLGLPLLPHALASLSSVVQLPNANPAQYRTIAGNDSSGLWFIRCQVPKPIILRRSSNRSGSYFACDNHFNTGVTLTWTVQDDGHGGTFLTIPAGQSTLLGANSTGCRTVTLSAQNLVASTQPVTFKGATSTASGLYVEIYFTADVTVQTGGSGVSDACP